MKCSLSNIGSVLLQLEGLETANQNFKVDSFKPYLLSIFTCFKYIYNFLKVFHFK